MSGYLHELAEAVVIYLRHRADLPAKVFEQVALGLLNPVVGCRQKTRRAA